MTLLFILCVTLLVWNSNNREDRLIDFQISRMGGINNV